MRKYPITLFIIGTLASGIIAIFYWMLTFSLIDPTTFEGWKELCYFFTFSFASFLFLVTALMQRKFDETVKFAAYGGLLPVLSGLFLSIKSLMICYTSPTVFDPSVWDTTIEKPFEQAVAIYRNKDLMGKSIVEIYDILGEESYSNQSFDVQGGWVLRIEYLDNKVSKIELYKKPPMSF